MSDNFQRLGRKKHPVMGPGVEVIFRLWDGWRQREEWFKAWYPVDQRGLTKHPRCPTGFSADFNPAEPCSNPVPISSVSRSCSIYEELCRYASFRWR